MDRAARVIETLSRFRNGRAIAERIASVLEEDLLTPEVLYVIFRKLSDGRTSEGVANTMCAAVLADLSRLKRDSGTGEQSYEQWQHLVNEVAIISAG
jgi:hypothetical protein